MRALGSALLGALYAAVGIVGTGPLELVVGRLALALVAGALLAAGVCVLLTSAPGAAALLVAGIVLAVLAWRGVDPAGLVDAVLAALLPAGP